MTWKTTCDFVTLKSVINRGSNGPTMHHSAMRSFDIALLQLLPVLVKAHVTDIISSVPCCLISHRDHLSCLRIKLGMRCECSRSQLSAKCIQTYRLTPIEMGFTKCFECIWIQGVRGRIFLEGQEHFVVKQNMS